MNNASPLRVLVVDDSALYRKIVREVLTSTPGVEVVGAANNGLIAVDQIKQLKPDVVTLDLEMPQLDGIGVLRQMSKLPDKPAAIMVSAFTTSGAKATTSALAEGAFDFILKPNTNSLEESVRQLRHDLQPKLQACRTRMAATTARRIGAAPTAPRPAARPRPPKPAATGLPHPRPGVIGVAVSTGGPQALTRLLPKLPADFPCPIALVQHMPPMFTASLAADLDKRCPLKVVEGRQGMVLRRGEIVIAPGGKQMRLSLRGEDTVVEITNDPPENNCKPAADYLFRSIASIYGQRSAGIVLTGMGDDGAKGAQAIKDAGGVILAQDEASCVVYGMPKAVVDAGLADVIAPLDALSTRLTNAAHGRVFA